MRLVRRQKAILECLCRRNLDRDGAQSGGEMVLYIWTRGIADSAFTSTEQGQTTAKQLVQKGLAEELGETPTGATCYGPTEKGRALFDEIKGNPQ